MYKYSKNLKYPLNLLEDSIGFLGDETKYSCGENGGAVREVTRERDITETLRKFGIEPDETFFKWFDEYIERKFGTDVKLMVDKRYKEKKSLRQIQKETGFSPDVIKRRISRIGRQICYFSREYRQYKHELKNK